MKKNNRPDYKQAVKTVISLSQSQKDKLLEECEQHFIESEKYMKPLYPSFDEKEALLIGQNEDSLSKSSASKIFDPRLSTIVYERAARVAAQNLKGKAYAVSKDDIGKNMVMNLLIDYFKKNDNQQFSHLIKMRMLSVYSLVYGTMFALVPWSVNARTGYMGAGMVLLPIRDCYPQPGIHQVNDMDWFIVRNVVTSEWLKEQDPETWDMKEINLFLEDLKESKTDAVSTKVEETKSYVERHYFPGYLAADPTHPRIELLTEFRGDKWVTWCPAIKNSKSGSKPYIFRLVDGEPYPDGMLPVVGKHAFPLIDSTIGLGEFERGKTLQYALNSLINLYMDGVKLSLFPPIHINPENVVKESIKWGAGEYWYMNNPNKDVQPMQLSPQGISTFNSTYGFLLSALQSQGGTTDINENAASAPSLGKTPEAIKFVSNREGSRDEWERVMLEEALKDVYIRWCALAASKMDVSLTMRIFGEEMKSIKSEYPEAVEIFKSGNRGNLKVHKGLLNDKKLAKGEYTRYDYEIETGSSYKPNIDAEQSNLTTVMKAVIDNPAIVEALKAKDKYIDLGELFKQWLIAGNVKNWDKIIKDIEVDTSKTQTDSRQLVDQSGLLSNTPQDQLTPRSGGRIPFPPESVGNPQINSNEAPSEVLPTPVPQTVAGSAGVSEMPQFRFNDPMIQAVAEQLLGGAGGIPQAR